MWYIDIVALRSIQKPAFHGLRFTFHGHQAARLKVKRFIEIVTVAQQSGRKKREQKTDEIRDFTQFQHILNVKFANLVCSLASEPVK